MSGPAQLPDYDAIALAIGASGCDTGEDPHKSALEAPGLCKFCWGNCGESGCESPWPPNELRDA
jgi:hypothetical protein